MDQGHTGHNPGSYESFIQYVPSHMRPFLFWYHISFCYIFALKVLGGHDFWPHLEMCHKQSDLLLVILNS